MKIYLSSSAEQYLDTLPSDAQDAVVKSLELFAAGSSPDRLSMIVDNETYYLVRAAGDLISITRGMLPEEKEAEPIPLGSDAVLVVAIVPESEVSL